jgi:4-aminobutyrate aminotransferase
VSKAPATKLAAAVIERAFHNGLLLLPCGRSTIRFMPPLMITKADVDEALQLFASSLAETASHA